MQVDFPFHFDGSGRTAETPEDAHVRDMIEQVLFTMPGERVNRPDFGCGLMQMVFAPNSDETAVVAQALAQGALQQWLGDHIQVDAVEVRSEDSILRVEVRYVVRRTGETTMTRFERGIGV